MKQSQTLWGLPRTDLGPPMSSACLLSVEKLELKNKLNQRSEKMQKQRKAVKQDNIVIV